MQHYDSMIFTDDVSNTSLREHGTILSNKFQITKHLGIGAQGIVYKCINMRTGRPYAVKLDVDPHHVPSPLDHELHIHQVLSRKTRRVPRLVEHGEHHGTKYIVMELHDFSISQRRHQSPTNRFSLGTTLRLGIKMAKCIRELHNAGFVHCDIKGGNYVIDNHVTSTVRIIDFGVSRRFKDPTTNDSIPFKTGMGFRGTVKYASPYAHKGYTLAPRDDYWSLLFSLVEMLIGRLPWDSTRLDASGKKKGSTAYHKTRWIRCRAAMDTLPSCFYHIRKYLKSLSFFDLVDHDYVINLMHQELKIQGLSLRAKWDWQQSRPVKYYRPGPVGDRVEVTPTEPRQHRIRGTHGDAMAGSCGGVTTREGLGGVDLADEEEEEGDGGTLGRPHDDVGGGIGVGDECGDAPRGRPRGMKKSKSKSGTRSRGELREEPQAPVAGRRYWKLTGRANSLLKLANML